MWEDIKVLTASAINLAFVIMCNYILKFCDFSFIDSTFIGACDAKFYTLWGILHILDRFLVNFRKC